MTFGMGATTNSEPWVSSRNRRSKVLRSFYWVKAPPSSKCVGMERLRNDAFQPTAERFYGWTCGYAVKIAAGREARSAERDPTSTTIPALQNKDVFLSLHCPFLTRNFNSDAFAEAKGAGFVNRHRSALNIIDL